MHAYYSPLSALGALPSTTDHIYLEKDFYMNSKAITATVLTSLLAAPAMAQTYITYEDGSIYTVPEESSVVVTDKRVFSLTKGDNLYRFNEVLANALRDGDDDEPPVDEPPVDEPPVVDEPPREGSHEWCKEHKLFANGFTFADQAFVRYCDTNNDYKYGCGDEKFDASEDGEVCPS